MSFQEAFTFFGMEVLLPHYEDQISAIWTVPAPATTAYVRFVDEVPQEVIAEAQARELDIVFQGGGEISMAQHDLRSDLAASALADAGYRNFMVGPDRENGTINIELRVPEGEHLPDEAEIVALVRERMVAYSAAPGDDASLDGRAAEIWPTDIAFAVTVSSEPIAVAD